MVPPLPADSVDKPGAHSTEPSGAARVPGSDLFSWEGDPCGATAYLSTTVRTRALLPSNNIVMPAGAVYIV